MAIRRLQIRRGPDVPQLLDGEPFKDNDGNLYIGHNGHRVLVSSSQQITQRIQAIENKKILNISDELCGKAGQFIAVNSSESGFVISSQTAEFEAAKNAAKSFAEESAQSAIASANFASLSQESAVLSSDAKTAALGYAADALAERLLAQEQVSLATNMKDETALLASDAENSANVASGAAQVASMANALAYNNAVAYNFPDVVAFTDGGTYRCIGTNIIGEPPATSPNWAKIAVVWNDFFEMDPNGDMMPSLTPVYSNDFELDLNGDIMPIL